MVSDNTKRPKAQQLQLTVLRSADKSMQDFGVGGWLFHSSVQRQHVLGQQLSKRQIMNKPNQTSQDPQIERGSLDRAWSGLSSRMKIMSNRDSSGALIFRFSITVFCSLRHSTLQRRGSGSSPAHHQCPLHAVKHIVQTAPSSTNCWPSTRRPWRKPDTRANMTASNVLGHAVEEGGIDLAVAGHIVAAAAATQCLTAQGTRTRISSKSPTLAKQ